MDGQPGLGRYRIRSRIGSGGMGEVYLATAAGPRGVEKLVAVKLVRGLEEHDRELVEMFIEEAKVCFLLTHPNVVQTFEIGQIDGHYFLVMEYIDGITLSQLLYHFREKLHQPLPTPFALYVAAQVSRGLEYAHNLADQEGRPLRIVHRDVSPSNVLLSRDGQVKVSDFGLAVSTLREFESQSGAVKGKAAYMAPEQLAARRVDARADIFALGVVLYEMLSGRSPFAENRRDVTISARIRGLPLQPFATVAEHVPSRVVALVDHCLAIEPEQRLAGAAELGRALEGCLRQLGQPITSYDFADFVAQAQGAVRATPAAAHPFDRALGMVIERVNPLSPAAPPAEQAPPAGGRVGRYITVPPVAVAGTASDSGQGADSILRRQPSAENSSERPVSPREPTMTDRSRARPASEPQAGLQATLEQAGSKPAVEPVSAISEVAAEASSSLAPPRQAWRRWLPAGAVVGLLAAGLLLLVSLHGPSPSPRGGGAPPEMAIADRAAAPAARALRLDGVRPPRDAAVPARTTPDLPRPRPKGRVRASGFVSINSEPWSNVFIDGVLVQSTPLVRHRLRAGSHRVLLVNPGRSLRAERRVIIRPEQVTELVMELKP